MESKIFMEIAQMVSDRIGVQLGEKQKVLVRSRLKRRMRDLRLSTAEDYQKFLKENFDEELKSLISILTTHHTFFFREFIHFEFLKDNLQKVVNDLRSEGRNNLKIWCAASSYGQEVYSLAIFLKVHLKLIAPEMTFEILGSDVDEKSVEFSKRGIYKWDEVKEIPNLYLSGHFARGTGQIKDFVKVKDDIKSHCKFKTINLMNFSSQIGSEKFDLIFCRNVFIYFNVNQIRSITANIMKQLNKSGYFFIGLSESLLDTKLELTHYGQAIYGHRPEAGVAPKPIRPVLSPEKSIPKRGPETMVPPESVAPVHQLLGTEESRPLRILAVDDSPTVLTLLKKILTKDHGFEVVGTAKDGVEANKIAKEIEFDAMTLDIHMPEMTGYEYLEAFNDKNHPPVVIVSSVSRENADVALRCIKAGAADYVEKPSLTNLAEKTDEIRNKIRVAVTSRKAKLKANNKLDASFSLSPIILDCESKVRYIFGHISSLPDLKMIIKNLKAPQPPSILVIDGVDDLGDSFIEQLQQEVETRVRLYNDSEELSSHRIYVVDSKGFSKVLTKYKSRDSVSLVLSKSPSIVGQNISTLKKGMVIGEDLGSYISKEHESVCKQAHYCVPATSFAYESEKYFTKERSKAS